jgi:hypothetical protein
MSGAPKGKLPLWKYLPPQKHEHDSDEEMLEHPTDSEATDREEAKKSEGGACSAWLRWLVGDSSLVLKLTLAYPFLFNLVRGSRLHLPGGIDSRATRIHSGGTVVRRRVPYAGHCVDFSH